MSCACAGRAGQAAVGPITHTGRLQRGVVDPRKKVKNEARGGVKTVIIV